MKKIFFSLVAIAALASCSKSEVQYEQTGEIAFTPIAKNITKSVAGYEGDTFDGVFPTAINLYVFANVQDEDQNGELVNTWNSPYFSNALFKHNGAKGTGGAYEGDPTRYWPNVKTLRFAGYSDAGNVNSLDPKPSMDFAANVLSINGYVQDNTNTDEGKNDLMWFPCDGNNYGRQSTEVVANMLHACSWITIKVAGDPVTSTYTTTVEGESVIHTGWTLNKLVVTSLKHEGDAECVAENKKATWTFADDADQDDETYYEGEATFTQTATNYETNDDEDAVKNNFIILPQTPTTLKVTYSYYSDTDIEFSETKVISLDYDGVDGTNSAWESGVHYIYNLTITATEILIDPVVVDWTPGTTPGTTI